MGLPPWAGARGSGGPSVASFLKLINCLPVPAPQAKPLPLPVSLACLRSRKMHPQMELINSLNLHPVVPKNSETLKFERETDEHSAKRKAAGKEGLKQEFKAALARLPVRQADACAGSPTIIQREDTENSEESDGSWGKPGDLAADEVSKEAIHKQGASTEPSKNSGPAADVASKESMPVSYTNSEPGSKPGTKPGSSNDHAVFQRKPHW